MHCYNTFELINNTSKFSQNDECWSVRTESCASQGCMSMLDGNNMPKLVPN